MQESDDLKRLDPLEKDVDYIYEKLISYMRIVKKTLCDMVPKAISLFTIKELEEFIDINLQNKLNDVLTDENVSIHLDFMIVSTYLLYRILCNM